MASLYRREIWRRDNHDEERLLELHNREAGRLRPIDAFIRARSVLAYLSSISAGKQEETLGILDLMVQVYSDPISRLNDAAQWEQQKTVSFPSMSSLWPPS